MISTFSTTNYVVGEGALKKLADYKGKKVALVMDAGIIGPLGLEQALYRDILEGAGVDYRVVCQVPSEPDMELLEEPIRVVRDYDPDVVVGVGGGASMDAAKALMVFLEHPDMTWEKAVSQDGVGPFSGRRTLVAVPTTSGTGSEVTDYAVITDREKGLKYPLSSRALRPMVAILDPELTVSAPPSVTADAGMDVLTHALEAYVSTGSNDFADAMCEKAVSLVFRFLPLAVADGNDLLAREKMHNASCMAGLAFNSAGLGLNHGMAHAIGGKLHIAHGRINAILLPKILAFNADLATVHKGEYCVAARKYQRMAKVLDLPAPNVRLGVTNLIHEVEKLNRKIGIPATLKAQGVDLDRVRELKGELVAAALADATTSTDPRPVEAAHVEKILAQIMG